MCTWQQLSLVLCVWLHCPRRTRVRTHLRRAQTLIVIDAITKCCSQDGHRCYIFEGSHQYPSMQVKHNYLVQLPAYTVACSHTSYCVTLLLEPILQQDTRTQAHKHRDRQTHIHKQAHIQTDAYTHTDSSIMSQPAPVRRGNPQQQSATTTV
jgi:hypothetical protein